MNIKTNYMNMHKKWSAIAYDEIGSLGFTAYGDTEIDAVFNLGARFGRNPSEFARPLEELLREGE